MTPTSTAPTGSEDLYGPALYQTETLTQGQFETLCQEMSEAIASVTSSPDLAAGPMRCDAPAGPTSAPSGPAAPPVSLSALLAKGLVKRIQGTYGPTSFDSYRASGPLCSWENRLRARLAMLGSTEWPLVWNQKTTPAGLSISRLRPSMRRTSGSGSTGWPTPTADDANNTSRTSGQFQSLVRTANEMAPLQTWPTPAERDYRFPNSAESQERRNANSKRGQQLPNCVADLARLAGWATPDTPSGGRTPKGGYMSITGQTPDGKKRQVDLTWQARAIGTTGSLSDPTRKASGDALNPAFPCWLQGYPEPYLSCAPSATR